MALRFILSNDGALEAFDGGYMLRGAERDDALGRLVASLPKELLPVPGADPHVVAAAAAVLLAQGQS